MGLGLGQLRVLGSRLCLPALAFLVLVSSLISARQSPSVLLLYEDCAGVGSVAASVAPNISSSSTLLLALPCGAASIPASQVPAASSNFPPVVVVMATCDVISVVASAMASKRAGEEDPLVDPVSLIPVPTLTTKCHGGAASWPCAPTLDPVKRLLDLTVSWMTYHSWSKATVLYDQSLDTNANIKLVKRFLATTIRLGTRLSFRKIPEQETTPEASISPLETLLELVLGPWEDEEARHVVVMADQPTVIHLLSIISIRENGNDNSDCDWLIFTSTSDDVINVFTPTIGHRVYFVNSPLQTGLRDRAEEAMRKAAAISRDSSTCRDTAKVDQITVYVKPPNYWALLTPPVVAVEKAAKPRLVPVYTWTPPPAFASTNHWYTGRLRALSTHEQYQLHGSHLYVATLRGEPFIKPLNGTSNDSNRAVGKSTQTPPPPLPAHITCQQPRAFTGFLVDMLDVLKSYMNFTYTLYEVCDNSYGSLKDGRWTGVVGEVMYAHAHIGLANLGANYARSSVVSFPKVSTIYGGAGIIMKRPQTTIKDLLAVYFYPFSVNVWVCIIVSIPVAALAMYCATRPRRRLRQLLKRCKVLWRRRQTNTSAVRTRGRAPIRITITRPSAGSTSSQEPERKLPSSKSLLCSTPPQRHQRENSPGYGVKDKAPDGDNEAAVFDLNTKEKEDVAQSFFSGVWFASTVLMQQGQEVVPETGPARLVFGTMWVAAVVLYAAYTSNLVSYFTVTKMSLPFTDLEGLVRSDYKFGTRQGSVYLDNMMTSQTDVFKEAGSKLESFGESVQMPTYEDAIRRTLQGSYAFIGDYVVLDYYQKKDCDLVLLKHQLFKTMSSFVLPRHSPILPAINYYMSRMNEGGILEKLRQRWWRAHPCPDAATVTAYQSIGLSEVCSAVLIMAVGVGLAVVVTCLEHLRLRLLRDARHDDTKDTTPSSYNDDNAKKTSAL
ncbi:uncharacterized protein [Panulirus ornatus]|uniref:uncharacterized protein n=1 Tax=Panulirus ornatus TaxID=150431 RepID=UPI003A8C8450